MIALLSVRFVLWDQGEIEKINTAIVNNPNYVKLQALEALKAISKDPASKIYFMDGDSPSPLPLMNIGDIK